MKKVFCLFLFVMMVLTADSYAFIYSEHGKRDPFGPLISPSGTIISYDSEISATDMNLEGVVLDSKGNNLAIINGKIVKATDQIGTYTVESISNDHVDLVKGQEHLTVKLKKGVL